MAFTKVNTIRNIIDTRYDYIKKLINEYPSIKEAIIKEGERECRRIAHDSAKGDLDVEATIYNQEISRYSDTEDLNNIFYQSMLLIVYSYYECIVGLLCKEVGAKQKIEAICKYKDIELSENTKENITFLDSTVREIRNNITHNNAGTCKKGSIMKKISDKYPEIDFYEDTIGIYNSAFILNALELEHNILTELAADLGLKHKAEGNEWSVKLQEWSEKGKEQ